MVRWTETALINLQKIYDYIAMDSKYYAKNIVKEIVAIVEKIEVFTNKGRVVSELKRREIMIGSLIKK